MSELSDEAKALIERVGTADGPGFTERARVKRRIAATLAGASAALGSTTVASAGALGGVAASKLTVASVALWLAAGVGLGAAASAPAIVAAYRPGEPVRAPSAVSVAPQAAPASAAEGASRERTLLPRGTETTVAPAEPAERAAADRPRAVASTGAASLAEETRLLHAAQRELAQKRTSTALALLDEHAARFPRGALAEERSAARVIALCHLGRTAEARSAAEAFVRASPRSPLVPRLRASCALAEPEGGNSP